MESKLTYFIGLILLLGAGCSVHPDNAAASTPTASISTATLSSTFPPAVANTPLPPLPAPTAAPVEGMTAVQLNVRAEPSMASNVLGMIPAHTKVEITGRDSAGNWWQILYPQGTAGKGWVTAQYVDTGNVTAVPVLGGGTDPDDGKTAVVQQQIHVRSGPGTGFNSLGTLNPGDVVHLAGKDASSAWLQIEFPAGPDGKAWINAVFVQARGVEDLPIVTEAGKAIGTATPTGIPLPSTPTVLPAQTDGDSQHNPIVSVVFEPLGTHTLIYSGDVSSPEGDSEDWIEFTPYGDSVLASLACRGNNDLVVSILENGQPAALELSCDDEQKLFAVRPGSTYLVRLLALRSSGGLQYTPYTIRIQSSP